MVSAPSGLTLEHGLQTTVIMTLCWFSHPTIRVNNHTFWLDKIFNLYYLIYLLVIDTCRTHGFTVLLVFRETLALPLIGLLGFLSAYIGLLSSSLCSDCLPTGWSLNIHMSVYNLLGLLVSDDVPYGSPTWVSIRSSIKYFSAFLRVSAYPQ